MNNLYQLFQWLQDQDRLMKQKWLAQKMQGFKGRSYPDSYSLEDVFNEKRDRLKGFENTGEPLRMEDFRDRFNEPNKLLSKFMM